MSSRRRPTIGFDPLDAVVPQLNGQQGRGGEPQPSAPTPQPAVSPQSRLSKERLTVHVPLEVIDRVKNAVYWTPGLTLAELAEVALRDYVGRLEKERGEAYPPRRAELKGGRPLK